MRRILDESKMSIMRLVRLQIRATLHEGITAPFRIPRASRASSRFTID